MSEWPHHAVVTIQNIKGLHARATARFVKTAESYDARVRVTRLPAAEHEYDPERDGPVGGTSMLGLMMLAAEKGSRLKIETGGSHGEACLEALSALVNARFDEE